jgi:hypothetical protein
MSLHPQATGFDAVGVPPAHASVLAQRTYPEAWARSWKRYYAVLFAILVLALLLPALVLPLSNFLNAARAEGALFVDGELGFGIVAMGFGSTLCAGWAASYLHLWFRPEVREYLHVRNIQIALRSPLTCWIYRRAAWGITVGDPLAFLEAQNTVMRTWWAIGALVFTVPSVVLVAHDLATYDVGTEREIERHSIMGVEHVSYDEVVAVEVGCAGGDRYTRGIYDLRLRDSDRIAAFPRRCPADRMERLHRLDQLLTSRGIPIGAAAESDPERATCDRELARRAGVPLDTVRRLLVPGVRGARQAPAHESQR